MWAIAVGCDRPAEPVPAGDSQPVVQLPVEPLELCINEFVPDNATGWQDETGAFADWVELHNPTAGDFPLDGWSLTDDPEDPHKHPLDGVVLPARGYLVFAADDRAELGPLHLSFGLAADGEVIGLFREDGAGELLGFGQTLEDSSWARSPDCCPDPAACTEQRWLGTPGSANAP